MSASAFADAGFAATVDKLVERTQRLYAEDDVPWVVGYSGGKDSTATLQLVWSALEGLAPEKRHKPVFVISTDTLVENPVVAAWVGRSLEVMSQRAQELEMPMTPHRLTPKVSDTFWVNLIGKGYPAPRPKFRWCTERLKINPSNAFIRQVVAEHGEAILVLGIRKAESSVRARSMGRQEAGRVRDLLSPNASLPNSLVYSPIEDWSNDDVWIFLMQGPNPWGYDNKDLLTMYQGASEDGECPLVVDTSTPSCGDSRFGCWTCTLVDKDKSMSAMIQNDDEKEWMLPLLELRDRLDVADDRHLRDFRRMNGRVQLFGDRLIHGPYLQLVREDWLRELLEAQRWIREHAPENVRDTRADLARRAARDPPHLGRRQARVRGPPARHLRGDDRRTVRRGILGRAPPAGRRRARRAARAVRQRPALPAGARSAGRRAPAEAQPAPARTARRAAVHPRAPLLRRRGRCARSRAAPTRSTARRRAAGRGLHPPRAARPARMILHTLTLDGVGPYAERQTLEFAHNERRPITLIGGLNGSGKTTIVRSLFHALYGARGLAELGHRRSYGAFLADSVHHGREDASLELTLTIPGLRDDAVLTVRRQWRRTGRSGSEDLDVFVGPGPSYDEELSESWDETIEQIAPLGIARLFFFDGEKIESLADLESAASSLRTAVGSLLGLDLVDQLRTDLVAVQRRVLRDSPTLSSEQLEKRQSEFAAAGRARHGGATARGRARAGVKRSARPTTTSCASRCEPPAATSCRSVMRLWRRATRRARAKARSGISCVASPAIRWARWCWCPSCSVRWQRQLSVTNAITSSDASWRCSRNATHGCSASSRGWTPNAPTSCAASWTASVSVALTLPTSSPRSSRARRRSRFARFATRA